MRGAGCLAALLVLHPPAVAGQSPANLAGGLHEIPLATGLLAEASFEPLGARRELGVAAASAAIPGAGQYLQGRRRWALFLAAELVGWGVHLDAGADGRRQRRAYRDLAWSEARGQPVPRVDGDFDYYERLAHWTRSGSYDSDPSDTDLQPERDPGTYNGAQWRLAADLFLGGDRDAGPGSAGYADALDFYRERAYGDAFLWDWSAAPERQSRFGDLIDESDGRFRTARLALAGVVANHLLSAVDAFVAERSGRTSPLVVRLAPAAERGTGAWWLRASIPFR
jgi:hypothetical protein